jgi:hypothetical protein
VIARLNTEPGLAPPVRAVAVALAERHPENPDDIRQEMQSERDPVWIRWPASERKLRLADAYLRCRPHAPEGLLERGIALYHLDRAAETEAELRRFRFTPQGRHRTSSAEMTRLGFLVLAQARQKKYDAAQVTLQELEGLCAVGEDWDLLPPLRTLVAEARKAVRFPRIPVARE